MRKGNSSNFQYGPDRGVSVPGAFKLDHLQPFKPILFPKIFNLFTFILGSPFLLPQRANYEKGEFFQLPIWTRQRGFSAWGIQTGQFAAFLSKFCSLQFSTFSLRVGSPTLLKLLHCIAGILQCCTRGEIDLVRRGLSRLCFLPSPTCHIVNTRS